MLNQITVVGYVGKDPDIRTAGTAPVANFSVATTEHWTNKTTGEKKEKTEWHNVSCFNALAKIVENNVKKGMLVFVQGQINAEKWTGKDGIERTDKKIKADTVLFWGGNGSSKKTNDNTPNAYNNALSDKIMDDLIPF